MDDTSPEWNKKFGIKQVRLSPQSAHSYRDKDAYRDKDTTRTTMMAERPRWR